MIDKVQQKVQHVTNVTTPTGGGLAVVGGLSFNEALAVGGFLIALASFAINWYYQHKRYVLQKNKIKDE